MRKWIKSAYLSVVISTGAALSLVLILVAGNQKLLLFSPLWMTLLMIPINMLIDRIKGGTKPRKAIRISLRAAVCILCGMGLFLIRNF